ncbi:hypothetical protein PR001_g12847 [Phytophthora rubi]|uniref:DDE-1 domain-containing protein n=1 Tax=Phytophthora rubi TaxID=129364 RepID=A0A6A3LZT6_9STRA|nr:hypothetical protein PR001_g12847 [Phytophthora rubi]
MLTFFKECRKIHSAQGCKVEAEVHMNILHKADKVVLAVQNNAYCDERLMLEWIKEVWKPSVTFCRVLLLDSLKVHKLSTMCAQLEELARQQRLQR